ncbi:MAG: ferredoxin family protein [Bilophila wadsworthia]
MPPVIDRTKCIGCGMCADVCPLQVFRHDPKKDKIPEVRRPYECWHCNACVLDCRAKAIELRLPDAHVALCGPDSQTQNNPAASASLSLRQSS